MGDPSTHLIYFSYYWYLVYAEEGDWVSTDNNRRVAKMGDEEKILDLKEVT